MATYLVKQGETERLIEAPNKASAIRHYVTPLVTAEVAEPADIVRVAKAGGDIEQAGE